MAARYEAFGLMELVARPEDAFRLCNLAVAEGRRIRGYAGDYYRLKLGDAEVVARAVEDDEGEIQLTGMDTLAPSSSRWSCKILKDVTPPDADPLRRRLLVGDEEGERTGENLAVLDVVCADVLPILDEGEEIELGVTAFPLRIDYSEDPCKPVISAQEDTVLLQGTVKDLRVGETYMGLEPMTRFVMATVTTPLGDVTLCHTGDMVPEEQKELVKAGATVSAYCILSGDAAVGRYAGGITYDEDHDLRLLRHFLAEGGWERLRGVLRSDCTFRFLQREAAGVEEALALCRDIDEAMEGQPRRVVDFGHITFSADHSILPGKHCLLIGDKTGRGYAMLAYVLTDSLGRVRSVTVTRDRSFDFEPDM